MADTVSTHQVRLHESHHNDDPTSRVRAVSWFDDKPVAEFTAHARSSLHQSEMSNATLGLYTESVLKSKRKQKARNRSEAFSVPVQRFEEVRSLFGSKHANQASASLTEAQALPVTDQTTFDLARACVHWPVCKGEPSLSYEEQLEVCTLLDKAFRAHRVGWEPAASGTVIGHQLGAASLLHMRLAQLDGVDWYQPTCFQSHEQYLNWKHFELHHIHELIHTMKSTVKTMSRLPRLGTLCGLSLSGDESARTHLMLRKASKLYHKMKRSSKPLVRKSRLLRTDYHAHLTALTKRLLEHENPGLFFDGPELGSCLRFSLSPSSLWLLGQFASWYGVSRVYQLTILAEVCVCCMDVASPQLALLNQLLLELKQIDTYPPNNDNNETNHRQSVMFKRSRAKTASLTVTEADMVLKVVSKCMDQCELWILSFKHICPAPLAVGPADSNAITRAKETDSLSNQVSTQAPTSLQSILVLWQRAVALRFPDDNGFQRLQDLLSTATDKLYFEMRSSVASSLQMLATELRDNRSVTVANPNATVTESAPLSLLQLLGLIEELFQELTDDNEFYKRQIESLYPSINLVRISSYRIFETLRDEVQRSLDPVLSEDQSNKQLISSITKVYSKLRSLHQQVVSWLKTEAPAFNPFPPLFVPFVTAWISEVREITLPQSMEQLIRQESWQPLGAGVMHSSSARDLMLLFHLILDVYDTLPQCTFHAELLGAVLIQGVRTYADTLTEHHMPGESKATNTDSNIHSLSHGIRQMLRSVVRSHRPAVANGSNGSAGCLGMCENVCTWMANIEYLLRGSLILGEQAVDNRQLEKRLVLLQTRVLDSPDARVNQIIMDLLNESPVPSSRLKECDDCCDGRGIVRRILDRSIANGSALASKLISPILYLPHKLVSFFHHNERPKQEDVSSSLTVSLSTTASFEEVNGFLYACIKRLAKQVTANMSDIMASGFDTLLHLKPLPQKEEDIESALDTYVLSDLNCQLRFLMQRLYPLGMQAILKALCQMLLDLLTQLLVPTDPTKCLSLSQIQLIQRCLVPLDTFLWGGGTGLRKPFSEGSQSLQLRTLIALCQDSTGSLISVYEGMFSALNQNSKLNGPKDGTSESVVTLEQILLIIKARRKSLKDRTAKSFLTYLESVKRSPLPATTVTVAK
eukprot:GILK01011945.1.p1 GENE.GILK01011945.1~~GILK01011945.1.p1  ORF type:complete len:1152 (+),score=200.13 GILK01011945.1:82-3537(+)